MPNNDVHGVSSKQRLTYIDPNTFASYFNTKNSPHIHTQELAWDPEDLAMSVDLQVVIPRRSDKGQENYFIKLDDVVMQNSGKSPIARYVSYMGGIPLNQKENSESYLTDNYTNISFQEVKDGKVVDKESLGIDSIDINFDAHFFPIVTIKFTDVRGSSLFMPSEYEFEQSLRGGSAPNSFFKALFHFPYPRFLLSIKGFYGNRVTFQLAVSDFRSEFQQDTGNYDVTVQFIGYVYGLYTDLPLNLVMASPYYNLKYWEERKSDTFKYVADGGGVGGEMKTYVEFLTALDDKDVTSELLESTSYVASYEIKKKQLSLLQSIKKLHSAMLDNTIGKEVTAAKRSSDDNIFVWGTYDTENNSNVDSTGFAFDADISKKYYQTLREYFGMFGTNSDYSDIVRKGNIFLDNIVTKIGGDALNIIKNDGELRYLPAFQTVKGLDIKSLFTFQTNKPNVVETNNGFLKAITDVGGDEVLTQDTRFKKDGNLKNNTKLKQDVKFGILINKTQYLSALKSEIELLEDELEASVSDVTTELKSVFESVVGFSPTVENFYRMLFAHIDCFLNYFNTQILGDITKQTKDGERKLGWFNNGDGDELKLSQLDIPRTLSGGSDKTAAGLDIYPFPGYYIEKSSESGKRTVAEFPGRSDNARFKEIREVNGVGKILLGVNFITEKIREIANSSGNPYTGDIFSILSPIYNGSNPWDSVEFSFADEEVDAYKMLYFYMCLLVADKAVGTGVYNELTDEDNYVTRVVNLLRGKIISAPDTFITTLQSIVSDIQSNGLQTVVENISRYKMNKFVLSQESNDKLVVDNKVEGSEDNYIPLKVVGKNFNKPISEILEENVDKHWAVNLREEGTNTLYTSITGDGMLSGEFSSEEKCKAYNSKLVVMKEGLEYLSGIDKIPYGTYGVSIPKTDETTTVDYEDWRDVSFLDSKDKIVYRKQIAYDLYDCEGHKTYKFRHKFHRLNCDWNDGGGVSDTGYEQLTIKPQIDVVTTDIKKYYNSGADAAVKYPVNFVGRKDVGYSKEQEDKMETGYGKPYVFYDDNPSVNLFSGIKTYSLFDNDSVTYLIEDGVPKTTKPSGCSDSTWRSFKSYIDSGSYLPLIETSRCKGTGVSEEDSKYALGTYLCAILSGVNTLGNISAKVQKCKRSEPVRLVEILYLGGVLYFQKKYKDEGKIDDATKFYELLQNDGLLGHGLLLHDRSDTLVKNQKEVTLSIVKRAEITDMFITRFKRWCDNELFGGIYQSLKFIDTKSETSDANPEYEDLLAFTGESNGDRRTIVQGYAKGSACEKWLTNLTYSYTHLLSIAACDSNKKNANVTKDDIIKFLELVINKINIEGTNDNSNSQSDLGTNSTDAKTALYYTLKNLYDKWLCTYTADEFKLKTIENDLRIRKERFCGVDLDKSSGGRVARKNLRTSCSEYNNFVYVDQFYNDISTSFILDADKIGGLVKDIFRGKTNVDVYTFMAKMAEDNNLMLIALPVFNNMYNASSIVSVFAPNTLYDMTNYDGANGVGTTYVVMYTNDVSHHPSLYEGYEYNRDYIDIADIIENKGSEDLKYFGNAPVGSNNLNYSISAFAVTYGKQNQMYFKKVNVSMDNPKTTDEAIRNELALSEAGSQGPTEQPSAIGQNIYSIYSNRSYTCTVEMLGCANITPLMYFQLNNVPMFRGLYMIINVKHTIKAGDMTTIFTGVRVSRYSLPDVNDILMHSSIFRRVMNILDTTNISIDGVSYGNGSSRGNGKESSKLASEWIACVEQMGTWYQNNIHTYQGAKNSKVKNRPGRRYYDCPLIGGASVCDDCSAFVRACLQAYGLSEFDKLSISTATMQPGSRFAEILQRHGFVRLPYSKSERKKGDIIVGGPSTHTEIYWGDGKSQSWGNTHDGLNGNSGMPCGTAEKTNYKHIYRLQA